MANSRPGIDSMMSTMRMHTASTQPPKAPATRPSAMPNVAPMISDTTPITRDWRAPHTRRLNTSRPSWSMPSQCSADGPGLFPGVTWSSQVLAPGSYGAMSGAKIATIRKNAMRVVPMMASGLWRRVRTASRHRLRPAPSSEVSPA